jgi:uncharacterized protein (DUF488 family)
MKVIPEGKADYLSLVDYTEVAKREWYQEGIEVLLKFASRYQTAIMCTEENPIRCHRFHLITKTLVEDRRDVMHIRSTGVLEPAFLPERLDKVVDGAPHELQMSLPL